VRLFSPPARRNHVGGGLSPLSKSAAVGDIKIVWDGCPPGYYGTSATSKVPNWKKTRQPSEKRSRFMHRAKGGTTSRATQDGACDRGTICVALLDLRSCGYAAQFYQDECDPSPPPQC